MKYILLTLTACFVLTLAVRAQPPKDFTFEYDKFKDRTQVAFAEKKNMTPFTGWFRHSGQILAYDQQEFNITFWPRSKCTGYCFNNPQLIFLIDGDRYPGPVLSHYLGDSATFALPRDIVADIAAAKTVEYQVGRYTGTFPESAIEKFKTLLELGTRR